MRTRITFQMSPYIEIYLKNCAWKLYFAVLDAPNTGSSLLQRFQTTKKKKKQSLCSLHRVRVRLSQAAKIYP